MVQKRIVGRLTAFRSAEGISALAAESQLDQQPGSRGRCLDGHVPWLKLPPLNSVTIRVSSTLNNSLLNEGGKGSRMLKLFFPERTSADFLSDTTI